MNWRQDLMRPRISMAVWSVTQTPSPLTQLLNWQTKTNNVFVKPKLLSKYTKLNSVLQRVVLVNVLVRSSIRVSMDFWTKTLSRVTLLKLPGVVTFSVRLVSLVEILLLAKASTVSAQLQFSKLLSFLSVQKRQRLLMAIKSQLLLVVLTGLVLRIPHSFLEA